MREEKIFGKFQQAWLSMDINSLDNCLLENVRFTAEPSNNSFTTRQDLMKHFITAFSEIKSNNAEIVSESLTDKPAFMLVYCFVSLYPVMHYMVNRHGIFLVNCLEPKFVSVKTSIKLEAEDQKISRIQVSQERTIQNRKIDNKMSINAD